jgi:hypothetical protein
MKPKPFLASNHLTTPRTLSPLEPDEEESEEEKGDDAPRRTIHGDIDDIDDDDDDADAGMMRGDDEADDDDGTTKRPTVAEGNLLAIRLNIISSVYFSSMVGMWDPCVPIFVVFY